ncbi:non-hydrolyzing UDP-N-acetylglucosamine 2-epimerase [Desulfobacca acetoxidans]|uniref:UDP-N-acetylglucosamine 2-epimerase n=1 Tax=Desulfobacca acetoxidans (strain ATCC 700848 / DSM 11109 / ASRB2) TaxID=880072 RepID=F2NIK1_DESAR|nr:UDP-N-acetylglucosamine 2-epimerase (non-hydrolyzing) [Desulfobacca acetoxidans]AEB10476.1 UDP-N-acetylglucosamine 2-epimerase [Desulfobacca acetoxidans DSM 11109]
MSNNKLKILSKRNLTDEICVIVGTRPGIIKMSPIIKEIEKQNIPGFTIHTGQHYSYEMDRKFFEDLELSQPRHHLTSSPPGSLHGEQTAHMLKGIEAVLVQEKPKIVLVCGDANTNLAGALAARKLQIEVGHVESGLRSNDWRMPEEHNRIIIDHISEYLFAPTKQTKDNLIQDNVKGSIYITGNTIVDALSEHIDLARRKSNILQELNIQENNYGVITCHREENVDDLANMNNIIESLLLTAQDIKMPLIFPVHPRTKNRLQHFDLWLKINSSPSLRLTDPFGYLDFLSLLNNASFVMTDSGGIQEESCVLKVPCITLRENTERQETIAVGSNIIAGTGSDHVLAAVQQSLSKKKDWLNPYGDGKAAKRIVDVCQGKKIDEWTGS